MPAPPAFPACTSASSQVLRVGVVGFGCFGQFLAGHLSRTNHVFVTSIDEQVCGMAAELSCTWVPWGRAVTEMLTIARVDVLIIATSIVSFASVVSELPFDLLRSAQPLIVDVLSVKEYPRGVLLREMPAQCDILCTHPMFGPSSGRGSWEGLRFVFDEVRISNAGRARSFLSFFELAGCAMVPMSCAQHDQQAASTQFLTHLTGRVLAEQACEPTPIDTVGYQNLCAVKDNVCKDSFDLFYGLFKYNQCSLDQLRRFRDSLSAVEAQLMERMQKESGERPRSRGAAGRPSAAHGRRRGARLVRRRSRDCKRASRRWQGALGA
uniref:Prephenate/arogenate dehydrogenase domain-containing protein n=1 Tax=Zooxanthella nutricula TaxID=1333877 RepID=A0A7S2QDY9_9DINO